MAGWTKAKRTAVEKAFYAYLSRCYVNSKDYSERIALGEHLYQGQRDLITQIFDALEEDIHKIYILKSRQLGISTIIRAMVIFLLGIHKGLKGAIVFDTDSNKIESRAEIETMIKDLPKALRFPSIASKNRSGLTLENDSKVLFMSAGVKRSKTSGTLGRSVGLTIAHCSELCSWDNSEGLEAFEQSLSDVNPDRLYIYESTARGFNDWSTMWENARLDTDHCKCIFLGWWSKDSQKIEEGDKDFKRYGTAPPTADEQKKIDAVKELYDLDITPEQLAWVRRKYDPASEEGEDTSYENTTRVQEQPWTESEAFQQTGAVFFADKDLTDLTNKFVDKHPKKYMFMCGAEFGEMRIYHAQNQRSIEFRVWEEPANDASYVVGIDPAFGENENNCNSAIQVMRCYADGVDQVAEYAWPLVTTRQLAWVISAIMAWYAKDRNEVRYILEINGPGSSVFNEIRSLKFQLDNAKYLAPPSKPEGLMDAFKNIKTYIYTRPDAMGPGYNWHWQTNTKLKILIMEQLRNCASNGKMRIRSLDVINEMRSISREGDSVGAQGTKRDDRTVALALANYYWETKVRPGLITSNQTREAAEIKTRLSVVDQTAMFNQNALEHFFAAKRGERRAQQIMMQRNAWRHGGRRF